MKTPSYEQGIQLDRGLVELKAGLDADGAQRLVEGLDLVAAIAAGQIDVEAIRGGFVYPVPVDYTLTVAQLLELGQYDCVNEHVTDAHFPISGEGVMEQRFRSLCLGRYATDEQVTEEFARQKCRDATNQELLSFGTKFPNVQRKFPVVQRSSVLVSSGGRGCVSCLFESSDGRERGPVLPRPQLEQARPFPRRPAASFGDLGFLPARRSSKSEGGVSVSLDMDTRSDWFFDSNRQTSMLVWRCSFFCYDG